MTVHIGVKTEVESGVQYSFYGLCQDVSVVAAMILPPGRGLGSHGIQGE
jgi:hypothetical protein